MDTWWHAWTIKDNRTSIVSMPEVAFFLDWFDKQFDKIHRKSCTFISVISFILASSIFLFRLSISWLSVMIWMMSSFWNDTLLLQQWRLDAARQRTQHQRSNCQCLTEWGLCLEKMHKHFNFVTDKVNFYLWMLAWIKTCLANTFPLPLNIWVDVGCYMAVL